MSSNFTWTSFLTKEFSSLTDKGNLGMACVKRGSLLDSVIQKGVILLIILSEEFELIVFKNELVTVQIQMSWMCKRSGISEKNIVNFFKTHIAKFENLEKFTPSTYKLYSSTHKNEDCKEKSDIMAKWFEKTTSYFAKATKSYANDDETITPAPSNPSAPPKKSIDSENTEKLKQSSHQKNAHDEENKKDIESHIIQVQPSTNLKTVREKDESPVGKH